MKLVHLQNVRALARVSVCVLVLSVSGAPALLADVSGEKQEPSRLEVVETSARPIIEYGGEPVLAFGPSPQNLLTYLPRGNGNSVEHWLEWVKQYPLKHVRSYPPSVEVGPTAIDLFLPSRQDPEKFDLSRLNPEYFEALGNACKALRKHGVIVHLQLWQAVAWKKNWDDSYYHPANNTNPELAHLGGPEQFSTTGNAELLEHQRGYVHAILDATGHLGNVYYDLMNEIGNGTAASAEWSNEILAFIAEWEREHRREVLVTLNDEGGKRMGDYSIDHPELDLVVKDLGRFEEHVTAQRLTGKPTVSVRNIEWDPIAARRTYFFGSKNLELTEDPDLHSRGRRYWWRMFISGVQLAGGYADAGRVYHSRWLEAIDELEILPWSLGSRQPTYDRTNTTERSLAQLYDFTRRVSNYRELLPRSGTSDHPVPNVYYLQSPEEAIIYLEIHAGNAGREYGPESSIFSGLATRNGRYRVEGFDPSTGEQSDLGRVEVHDGVTRINIPGFVDDYAVHLVGLDGVVSGNAD